MEGSKHLTSVGDALQEPEVRVPQPGDDEFDPTAPQPGDPDYEAWLAAQAAPPMRPSERVEQEEALQRDPADPGRPVVLGYLVPPRLALELVAFLGQCAHDDVRHLIDGLQQATAIPAERAGSSAGGDVDQEGENG